MRLTEECVNRIGIVDTEIMKAENTSIVGQEIAEVGVDFKGINGVGNRGKSQGINAHAGGEIRNAESGEWRAESGEEVGFVGGGGFGGGLLAVETGRVPNKRVGSQARPLGTRCLPTLYLLRRSLEVDAIRGLAEQQARRVVEAVLVGKVLGGRGHF